MELVSAAMMPEAFRNMFNLYAHELSEYNSALGAQRDADGNYLPETVTGYINSADSYCMVEDGLPVGLAVFSSETENETVYHDIEELFVIRTARRRGIAQAAAERFWRNRKGIGLLYIQSENRPALEYWERLLNKLGYEYETEEAGGMIRYSFKL